MILTGSFVNSTAPRQFLHQTNDCLLWAYSTYGRPFDSSQHVVTGIATINRYYQSGHRRRTAGGFMWS